MLPFRWKAETGWNLRLGGREYGLLAEGDKGKLHFQGTRYLGFDRNW